MQIYNLSGSVIIGDQNKFDENISIKYAFDSPSSTNYTVFRINKNKYDGSEQFAFCRCIPGSASDVTKMKTPFELSNQEGWLLVVNGGIGTGLMIENSVVIDDTTSPEQTGVIPLCIDSNGDLGYLDVDYIGKGQTYVSQGIVSAMCGFFPIIDDYDDFDYPTDIPGTDTTAWQYAQRQIIGQFGNGDYMLLTSEGRNIDNSVGLTMADAQRICKAIGVKFAYNLDGGGATQTVIGKRIVNIGYDQPSGRKRGTFIVFNGTDTFSIPNT